MKPHRARSKSRSKHHPPQAKPIPEGILDIAVLKVLAAQNSKVGLSVKVIMASLPHFGISLNALIDPVPFTSMLSARLQNLCNQGLCIGSDGFWTLTEAGRILVNATTSPSQPVVASANSGIESTSFESISFELDMARCQANALTQLIAECMDAHNQDGHWTENFGEEMCAGIMALAAATRERLNGAVDAMDKALMAKESGVAK